MTKKSHQTLRLASFLYIELASDDGSSHRRSSPQADPLFKILWIFSSFAPRQFKLVWLHSVCRRFREPMPPCSYLPPSLDLYFTDISRGKSNKAFSTCQFRRRSRTPKIYNSLIINIIQNHPVLHLSETLQMENTQSFWNQPLSPSTFTFHHQLPLPLWPSTFHLPPSTFTFHFHTIQCRPHAIGSQIPDTK